MDSEALDAVVDVDLPHYSVRVSMRAKRLQIKVNHWGKVEVVVPRNVKLDHVAPFVRKHRRWLERTLAEVQGTRYGSTATATELPERVRLSALAEDWEIIYRQGTKVHFETQCEPNEPRRLLLESPDGTAAHIPMQSWIYDHARRHLPPWLLRVSEECGLPYTRVSVRAQKTRWGSCSARGHINLNRHLLFLPPRLVRYVMLHELCHTVHLNHSKRYWRLVGRFVPDIEVCESELRRAARHIPLWACPD